jgi:hypothetical protein
MAISTAPAGYTQPGATARESVRPILRTTPPRFKELQPLRPRQGPKLFAILKSVFVLENPPTESGIRRRYYTVQKVFHGAIEHHYSVSDTSRLWRKGRLCFLYAVEITLDGRVYQGADKPCTECLVGPVKARLRLLVDVKRFSPARE